MGDRDCISACESQPGTLKRVVMPYFRCLHGPQDRGTRFRLRTTLNCASGGDWPALDDVVDGGVGGIVTLVVSKTERAGFRTLSPPRI
jgi:hypothetical protein